MTPSGRPPTRDGYAILARRLKDEGRALGFQQVGIADTDLRPAAGRLADWLAAGMQGTMDYMARHGTKRSRPEELVPGTRRVVSVRMDYLPEPAARSRAVLADPGAAYVSRYALGRDYHKVLRTRLKRLAALLDQAARDLGEPPPEGFVHRPFVDSAPVLEKPLAQKAGLGWIGKHTNLLDARAGSWFFLGNIYTHLPLPPDPPARDHCGTCRACMDACPTRAIVAPYVLDARLCISYLTIEHRGPIPIALRPAIGNRVFGCDDCQLFCPFNRFAREAAAGDFKPRRGLEHPRLIALFPMDEPEFLALTAGSAIRRIGHELWLRNLAVALGNAPPDPAVRAALEQRRDHPSPLVREHVAWALARQGRPAVQARVPAP